MSRCAEWNCGFEEPTPSVPLGEPETFKPCSESCGCESACEYVPGVGLPCRPVVPEGSRTTTPAGESGPEGCTCDGACETCADILDKNGAFAKLAEIVGIIEEEQGDYEEGGECWNVVNDLLAKIKGGDDRG